MSMPTPVPMELNDILRQAVEVGASDIHLKFGRPPMLRRDGSVIALPGSEQLSNAHLDSYLRTITGASPGRYDRFQASGDLDIAYTAEGLPRFRVNAFRQRGMTSFALRVIPR
jgi:twitching motility protein PilT